VAGVNAISSDSAANIWRRVIANDIIKIPPWVQVKPTSPRCYMGWNLKAKMRQREGHF
jgi:hypothetical protein